MLVICRSLSRARECTSGSQRHPRCYFHPDTAQQGCCRGFLMTLYGSVWGRSKGAARSSSRGKRPELSDYCRCQGESAWIRHFIINVCFFTRTVDCFSSFLSSCQTYALSSKIAPVSVGVKTSCWITEKRPRERKKTCSLPEWTSLTQLWRSNILQHSALLCL